MRYCDFVNLLFQYIFLTYCELLGETRAAIPNMVQEDKMYLKPLSNGSIVSDPGVEFLSIANLPTVVGVW